MTRSRFLTIAILCAAVAGLDVAGYTKIVDAIAADVRTAVAQKP